MQLQKKAMWRVKSPIHRNFISPMPSMDDLAQFNNKLREFMLAAGNGKHYTKGGLINDLWKGSEKQLLRLLSAYKNTY